VAKKTPSSGPPRRFARAPDSILVALAFTPNRENKAKLKYWQTFDDWPKKGRNGFDIAELKAFLDRHFDEFLADSKRAKGIEQGDKFSGGDMKLLRSSHIASGHGGNNESIEDTEPLAKNQAAIANFLARHFQVPVSKMDVSDWLHGRRLDNNVPNFPVPDEAGRFNKLKCADWFRAYKFHDPRDTTTPDLFKKLENQRAKSELERLEHEGIMRRVERGYYIEKAEHNRVLAGLGQIGRNNLWELFDQRAYQLMEEALRTAGAGLSDEWRQVVINAMRKIMPELLLKHHAHLEAMIQEQEMPVPTDDK
jgi:hypothetical protein